MTQWIESLKRSPSILFGIVALIVCCAVGLLRTDQLTQLSSLEAELNARLDKISFNIKHSENIESDTQRLREIIEIVDERLFIEDERSTNIDFFYSFEDRLDITISEVNQLERGDIRYSEDGPDTLARYSVVYYEINVNGSFHEILRFLYEIYQIDPIIRISGLQIGTDFGNSDATTGVLSAQIRAAVLAAK